MEDFTEMDTFSWEDNVEDNYTLVADETETSFAPDNADVTTYEQPASSSLDPVTKPAIVKQNVDVIRPRD